MRTIILSLHERWWKKIAAGEKTMEIRKTKPVAPAPVRVLVYVTGGGGVQGEFVCDHFYKIRTIPEPQKQLGTVSVTGESCLTAGELKRYAGPAGKPLWGWRIKDVKEYQQPQPLEAYGVKAPPQSWRYYMEGKQDGQAEAN